MMYLVWKKKASSYSYSGTDKELASSFRQKKSSLAQRKTLALMEKELARAQVEKK